VFGIKSAAWLFFRISKTDLLIVAMPTITSCCLGVLVAKLKGATAVVEVRDKWPDVFQYGALGLKRVLIGAACKPIWAMVSFALRNSTLITAPSLEYKAWVERRYGIPGDAIIVSPLGYQPLLKQETFAGTAFAHALMQRAAGRTIVCFFGTVGRMFDIETVVRFALSQKTDEDPAQQFYFVFLGGGDYLAHWQKRVAGSPFVEFVGWVSKDVLDDVARVSSVALAPYRNTPNFEGHVPNKIMEYMYYGLPIVTCLKGEVREIVESNRLGAYYDEGDLISFGFALRRAASLDADVSRRAKEYFRANYDAEVIYRRLLEEIKVRRQSDVG